MDLGIRTAFLSKGVQFLADILRLEVAADVQT